MDTHCHAGKCHQRRPYTNDKRQPPRSESKSKDGNQDHARRMAGWKGVRVGFAVQAAPLTLRPSATDSEFDCQNQGCQDNNGQQYRPPPQTPKRVAQPPEQAQTSPPKPRIARMCKDNCDGSDKTRTLGHPHPCGQASVQSQQPVQGHLLIFCEETAAVLAALLRRFFKSARMISS
jgi:hypothetical protein